MLSLNSELDDFPVTIFLELPDDEIERIKRKFEKGDRADVDRRIMALRPQVRLPAKIYGFPLSSPQLSGNPVLTDFIKAKLAEGYDFRLLQVVASLIPAPKTILPSVRIEVTLGAHNNLQPTVYTVLPMNIYQRRTYETEKDFSPTCKIDVEGAEVSLGHWVRRETIEGQEFDLFGYFGDSSAGWMLQSQGSEGVRGTWEFQLIAEWPPYLESVPVAITVQASFRYKEGLFFPKRNTYCYERIYRKIS